MTALKTVAAIPVAILVTLASLPWIAWAIGCAACGDQEREEAAMRRSPMWRYMDWIEARHGA